MRSSEQILDRILKYAAYNPEGELVARQPYGHKYRMKIDGQLRTLQSWSYIAAHGKPATGRIVSTSATEDSIDPRYLILHKEIKEAQIAKKKRTKVKVKEWMEMINRDEDEVLKEIAKYGLKDEEF